jgi:hypothetical protein
MIKSGKISLLLSLLFLIFACNQNKIENNLNLKTVEFKIPINVFLLSDYFQYSNYKIHDTLYISAYNYLYNKIDIFDLKNRAFSKSVILDHEGPNAIRHLLAHYLINSDSILLICQNNILIIDYQGTIINDIPINNRALGNNHKDSFDFTKYSLSAMGNYFDPEYNEGKIFLFKEQRTKTPYKPDFFAEDFMVMFDLNQNAIREIPIGYPEELKLAENIFEYLWYPLIQNTNSKIIYSFLYTPILFEFNRENNNIIFTKNREVLPPAAQAIPTQLLERPELYASIEPMYFKMHYDSKNEVYWRLYYARKKENETNRVLNLLMYDKNLSAIYDKPVENGERLFPAQAFFADGKFYIPIKGEYMNEVYLGFTFIEML